MPRKSAQSSTLENLETQRDAILKQMSSTEGVLRTTKNEQSAFERELYGGPRPSSAWGDTLERTLNDAILVSGAVVSTAANLYAGNYQQAGQDGMELSKTWASSEPKSVSQRDQDTLAEYKKRVKEMEGRMKRWAGQLKKIEGQIQKAGGAGAVQQSKR